MEIKKESILSAATNEEAGGFPLGGLFAANASVRAEEEEGGEILEFDPLPDMPMPVITPDLPLAVSEEEKIIERPQQFQQENLGVIEPTSTKKNGLKVIDDQVELFNLLNEYAPKVTKRVPLICQGIMIELETLGLSDLNAIALSDTPRIKAINMVYAKMSKGSKSLFNNSIETFYEAVSVFDLNLIFAAFAEAFGDEEFETICENPKCKCTIEFKRPLKDLRVISDVLKKRIQDVERGINVGVIDLGNNIIQITDEIAYELAVPSLKKYAALTRNVNVSDAIFKKLLLIDAIIFTEKNVKVPYEEKNLDFFISMLEKVKFPKDWAEDEGKIFEPLSVRFIAKLPCPECGTISEKVKEDMLMEVIEKGLA